MTDKDRRAVLGLGLAAGLSGIAADAFAQSAARGDAPTEAAPARPAPDARYRVPFAVIGLDHSHVYAITDAMIRGGGVLSAVHAADPGQLAAFRRRYDDVPVARTEAEILGDPAIKPVCSAAMQSPEIAKIIGKRTNLLYRAEARVAILVDSSLLKLQLKRIHGARQFGVFLAEGAATEFMAGEEAAEVA